MGNLCYIVKTTMGNQGPTGVTMAIAKVLIFCVPH
jgi:hypothetical protein